MSRFIPISKPSVTEREVELVSDAVRSTWISSLGKYIDQFEAEFANFCGTKYAVSTSNGTVALHLALVALGVGKGDEVIIPDLSFVATVNTVLHAGATPVFADIDPHNLCLDTDKLESYITPATKAIMPVHIYGHPSNMPLINAIAEKHGLLVIEDAAEAHGASIGGQLVGSFGHCASFSFYGNKNITTGEGGMITTNDDQLNQRLRFLRDHAMSKEKRYWHTECGYNYRMTNMQAALGCAQMERAEKLLQARVNIFDQYQSYLGNDERISLNRTSPWATNTYWLICLELNGYDAAKRDMFIQKLRELGVDSRPYFYPMSTMPYLTPANTPVAHAKSAIGLNLPTYVDLTAEEIEYVSKAVKNCL